MTRPALVVSILIGFVAGIAGADAGAGQEDPLAQMAREHAGDAPVASPLAATAPEDGVATEDVPYAHLDGKAVVGYLARPADGSRGAGVLVIHEWWGLNDNIRAMTRRLAAEGYTALAVDLYEGEVAEDPETARRLATTARDTGPRLEENLRQAYAYLTGPQAVGKVATIGWCFGGGWSLRAALLLPEDIDATVVYYGRLETDPEALRSLRMPVLGIFGALDQGIPVADVRAFETAMTTLGKPVSIHVYEGADHAFANPSGSRYNAEAAEDAWSKTLDFLASNLRSR